MVVLPAPFAPTKRLNRPGNSTVSGALAAGRNPSTVTFRRCTAASIRIENVVRNLVRHLAGPTPCRLPRLGLAHCETRRRQGQRFGAQSQHPSAVDTRLTQQPATKLAHFAARATRGPCVRMPRPAQASGCQNHATRSNSARSISSGQTSDPRELLAASAHCWMSVQ